MYRGFLNLNEKVIGNIDGNTINNTTILEYGMECDGDYINISETLNSLLSEKIHITVGDYKGNKLFDGTGILLYQKLDKSFYNLFVGDLNLDEVLWNNVNNMIEISIKCLSKESNNGEDGTES